MTLTYIVLATMLGGLLSVTIAATLTRALLGRLVQHLVSLSAGVLLGTALLHVLPEAFESEAGAHDLFLTLLAGLLFFFLLEKAELYRHGHPHEGDPACHHPHPGFDADPSGRGAWNVLVGDSVHNFCDGVIIATAFLADVKLGILSAFAVLAHEIPQEVSDYIVLLNAGFSKRRALLCNALSGLASVGGGVAGFFLVATMEGLLPHLLIVAASSFIYVAMADLIPQMQRRLALREAMSQLLGLGSGLGFIALLVGRLHVH